MKKLYFNIVLLLLTFTASSQTPNYFKYQAMVRDSSGFTMASEEVSLRISILEGNVAGIEKYVESHQVTTNPFGLVNLNIGGGTVISGEFTSISWGDSLYFIKTELDIAETDTFELMGISQILSVPIALYAEQTGDTSRWRKQENHVHYKRGNVGIGTSIPLSMLHLSKNASLINEKPGLIITNSADNGNSWFMGIDPGFNSSALSFKNDSLPGFPSLLITEEGKVGIRKINPDHTLDVEGTIYASQGIHFADSTFINSATSFWTGYDNCVFQEAGSVVIGNSSCSQYKLAISPDTTGKGLSISDITRLDEEGALNIQYPGGSVNQLGYFNTLNNEKFGYGMRLMQNSELDTIQKWAGIYIDYAIPDTNKYAAIFKSGNVGIGTDNPLHSLHIEGTSMINGMLGIGTENPLHSLHVEGNSFINGNLGINMDNPKFSLDLAGDIRMQDTIIGDSASFSDLFLLQGSEHLMSSKIEIGKGLSDQSKAIKLVTREGGKIQFFTDSKIRMQIRDSVVVIGRPIEDKYVDLDVNGSIRTREVEVFLGEWWDCVFESDYDLPPLSEVETYIKDNKHLPGIPSEEEVLEEGINLGEMDGLLLKKIEELTLYLIELKKENEFLAAEIEKLKE